MCFHEDLSADTRGGGYLHQFLWFLLHESLRMSIYFFMQCESVHVGRKWRECSYLAKEITTPMFSVNSVCIARFLTSIGKLTLSFNRSELYFSQSEATTTEKSAVPVFVSPWLNLCHWHTERHISARRTKTHAENQSFPDDIGYLEAGRLMGWAGGHVGSLQVDWEWFDSD